MNARIRWQIAYLLNRSRRFCWANLVDWALNDRKTRRACGYGLGNVRVDSLCTGDLARTGTCYCGKLRRPSP